MYELRTAPRQSIVSRAGTAKSGSSFGPSDGFTLIELMTVVVVIGILSVVAIPNFLRATARAKRASCFSNQRQVANQALLYAVDQRIADDQFTVDTLVGAGYCTSQLAECPSSEVHDHDDYEITIVASQVTDIECTVEQDEHEWTP